MKTIEIKGSLRTELGKKSSQKTRKEGNVPCVIYGKEQNIHFHAHENSFKKLVYTPDAHIVRLDLEGKEYRIVMQDIQFHPVTDKVTHIDFIEVVDDKPIIIALPIQITGDSVGVKAGGKLRIKRRHLKVRGLASDIPESLPIDITNLKVNHSIRVGDLKYDKIELIDPRIATVLSVATSRVVSKEEGEAEAEHTAGEAAEAAAPADEAK
ncbi:MAG TPA: 50S ribosomal protein L25/general stress protein Ctc [Bacteroidales bacterium]|jgi:large subunit ribosomal protein L25|nr:50S ribosomal protein L25/general stress protein Ctc [Bacteroidales bacterium]MDI9552172.1 50S ribosomal protein L25/general stress protein Ctc [Bacteroidota bacterium]MZP66330.1 50S ribosomal protein L25/general stress protein Ctc [Bacteroidales bacterium]NLK54204.1 50S ribosomal protein L25/general stress protein Ctc [Bacteroidales bacterium]HNY53119.1 50S ribosomal protein L25/general stress protein Ctc [Bacteroidales bacterium]